MHPHEYDQQPKDFPLDIDPPFLQGTIDAAAIKATLENSNIIGTVSLRVIHSESLKSKVGSTIQLDIRQDDRSLLDGDWQLISIESCDSTEVLNLRRGDFPNEWLKDHPINICLNAEVFFRKSAYRVLNLEHPNDLKEYVVLIEELNSISTLYPCVVRWTSNSAKTWLDFSEETAATSSLHITHSEDKLRDLSVGTEILIDFSAFGARFFVCAKVEKHIAALGLLATAKPKKALSITPPRFLKLDCDVDCSVLVDSLKIDGKIASISPDGGDILLSEDSHWLAKNGRLQAKQLGIDLPINMASRHSRSLKFQFRERYKWLDDIRTLMAAALPPSVTVRTPAWYQPLFELYQSIGYGPKAGTDIDDWTERTRSAWEVQDARLPGNTIIVKGTTAVETSLGLLPISSTAVYGHSLAMAKTLLSAGEYLSCGPLHLAWTSLIPGAKYYLGSVRKHARFASRLYNRLDCLATPSSFERFSSIAILDFKPYTKRQGLVLQAASARECRGAIPHKFLSLLKNIDDPHHLFSDIHTIKTLKILGEDGEVIAIAVVHSSPKYFTAVNVYRCVWLFEVGGQGSDMVSVGDFIRSELSLHDHEVDLFLLDDSGYSSLEVSERVYEDIWWYQFMIDDFGAVISSFCRSALAAIKQYGGTAEKYLSKLRK